MVDDGCFAGTLDTGQLARGLQIVALRKRRERTRKNKKKEKNE